MKIVFFGSSSFAIPAMEALAPHIRLVVSQPDRPTGRKLKAGPTPVKTAALELGLPIETPEKCRSLEFIETIRGLEPDMLMVAAYGQILPQTLLEAAKHGGINLHGSLLPKYRGAAPVQRAIQRGEKETGVTLMQMDRGLDTGDMIASVKTPIYPDETAGELSHRLADLAAQLAVEWAPRISSGEYPCTQQNNAEATYAGKVDKSEAEIFFDSDAVREYRKWRAFTPTPGAYAKTILGTIKLNRIGFIEPARDLWRAKPGEVLAILPNLVISCFDGALAFYEVQPDSKHRVAGTDWAHGVRLKVGMNIRIQ